LSTASAQDLSTANTNTLNRFWVTAQAANRPLTVVSFGDSMANSIRLRAGNKTPIFLSYRWPGALPVGKFAIATVRA